MMIGNKIYYTSQENLILVIAVNMAYKIVVNNVDFDLCVRYLISPKDTERAGGVN